MSFTIRTSLAGNDVLTDTNLDHYSLYADSDNVLIKEKARGAVSISATTTQTIAHNLGYIPDFKVFVDDQESAFLRYGWKQVAAQNSGVTANNFYAYCDTTNLYITNNTGSSADFVYYIFYDNQGGSASVSITETSHAVKVSKQGEDAETSTDPNDYIFHSDLNTFKILKEARANLTYTSDGVYTINHNLSLTNEAAFDLFVKIDSTYAVKAAGENTIPHGNFKVYDAIITTTQIKFYVERLAGSGTAIEAKYYIYETPLSGSSGLSITSNDNLLRVSKAGINGLTETDPNNYTFLSGYNTLKYVQSGSTTITIIGDGTDKITTTTIPHNLGYHPFVVVFTDDFVNFAGSRFSAAPFRSDTASFIRRSGFYFDDTNLYVQMYNKSSNTYTVTFYYKIYKNNLGF